MKKIITAACIITLAVFSIAASGNSEQEAAVSKENRSHKVNPPPVDIAGSEDIETATFGLG